MDTALFIIAKLVGLMIRVETWLVIGLAISVVAGLRGRGRLASRAGLVTLAALLTIGMLPLHHPALHWLESRHPRPDPAGLSRIDGIIVLGGAEDLGASRIWGVPQVNAGAERIIEGAALARAHSPVRLVHAGGSGRLADLGRDAGQGGHADTFGSEAEVARALYLALGVATDQMVFETRSRNTFENARNLVQLMSPDPGQTWLLITSAAHMPRAVGEFRQAGWDSLVPWPVDYRSTRFRAELGWSLIRNMAQMNQVLHEGLGLAAQVLRARRG